MECWESEFAEAFRGKASSAHAAWKAVRALQSDAAAADRVNSSALAMRALRSALEGDCNEIAEAAAAALEACAACACVASPRSVGTQCFCFAGGVDVTLRELGTGDDRLGEGGCVWAAALMLAQHLARCAGTKFGGTHRCLELGAGCGLVGIVAATLGAVSVVLSELRQPVLLAQLQANIEMQPVEVCLSAHTAQVCVWQIRLLQTRRLRVAAA